ncbi:hypothetical protein PHYPSEUDO_006428 [Phytophthora pseudosyringae]|uniref:Uncharacterized protein n=1 Tax=Phytophthora pseudosyringae TaxID=221518 RepID=A0A8T1VIR0_9STRA|nr:hypothetical protein PHYPSEUDO_006427 [Phytophthora pseudosyringae]KAG7381147.1 hypothetical protein PHYPSEUDO_006428 [Phytophthora pseudosyringae]
MKLSALAVVTLAAVASVASANDYQPSLRALAAPEPAAPNAVAPAAGKENADANVNAGDKKKKEWYGGFGWGRPCGGLGWGGGWGGWGGMGGWGW